MGSLSRVSLLSARARCSCGRVRCSSGVRVVRCAYLSCISFSLTIVIGIEQAFNTDWVEEPINTLDVEPTTTTTAQHTSDLTASREPKLHEGREHYLLKSDT